MQQHTIFDSPSAPQDFFCHERAAYAAPTQAAVITAADMPCRHCGSLGPHIEGPGTGPHHAKLICGDCGHFLRWLSLHAPEERPARRQQYQHEWMAQQPVTAKQRRYLAALGHHGPTPGHRLEASQCIETLLHAQRKGTP